MIRGDKDELVRYSYYYYCCSIHCQGYREGLVKQLINLFGFIISLFVAYYYYDDVAPYLVDLFSAPNFDNSSFYF